MRLLLLPFIAADSAVAGAVSHRIGAYRPAADCTDRIEQVRDDLGQPRLDRSPATPGEGYLIAAVDKRVDGCPVMQMLRDADDLRPVPRPTLGPARLQPAR